jgi:hypothetical protein
VTASHPSAEVLRAFYAGSLPPAELLAADDHVAQCAECRALLSPGADAAVQRFTEGLTGEDAAVDLMPHSHVRRWTAIGATAAAAAAVVIAVLLLPRHTDDVRPLAPRPRLARAPEPRAAQQPAPDPLASLDPSLRDVATALQSGALVSANILASLGGAPEQQRAADPMRSNAARLIAPVGVVLESDRPTFRWDAEEAATVKVFDREFNLVAESPRLQRSSWTAPARLPRGATYQWQLSVHRDDGDVVAPAPPVPPAMFHVISEGAFAELTAARKSDSPLEIGLICMREGLLDEGARMLARYAEENPGVPIAARLSEQARAAMSVRR